MAALVGSRCAECVVTIYPADGACPRCGQGTAPVTLATEGMLWTWTVQRYAPKSPPYVAPLEGFQPFAVCYVEMPERVRVAAVLDVTDLDTIRIGTPVRIEATAGVPRATPIGPTLIGTL
jgi:uncharacterized OB-fold protein